MGGIVIDEWTEVVPSTSEITGLALHYETPMAQAPQSVLIAVPADPAQPVWTAEIVEQTLIEALTLAKIRMVDPDCLANVGQLLPALYFANNIYNDTISTEFFPANCSIFGAAFSGADVIITNNGLTVQGGNVASNEIAESCSVNKGYYYFEVTFDAGIPADSDGVGIALTGATTANIAASWNGGFGVQTNSGNNVFYDGLAADNIGAAAPGNIVGIALNTVDGRAWITKWNSINGQLACVNRAGNLSNPSIEAGMGGGYNIASVLGGVQAKLCALFLANTSDKFTINNGATPFNYVPPMGYTYGWQGVIPNGASYSSLDRGSAVAFSFGPNNYGGQGTANAGGIFVRSQTSKAWNTGKCYAEFLVDQLINDNVWVGVIDGNQGAGSAESGSCIITKLRNTNGQLYNFTPAVGVGQICMDLINKLVWLRGRNADNWNLNGTANPATGVGGMSISSLSSPIYLGYGSPSAVGDAIFVLITNPSYMQYTAPSGFTAGW
jgi:hypothetical protein